METDSHKRRRFRLSFFIRELIWGLLSALLVLYVPLYDYHPCILYLVPVAIILAAILIVRIRKDADLSNKLLLYKLTVLVPFFFSVMCLAGSGGRTPYWIKGHDWDVAFFDVLLVAPIFAIFVLPFTLALGYYLIKETTGG